MSELRVNRFLLAFLLVLTYEFLMEVIQPEGLTGLKAVISILPWLSFYFIISTFGFYYPKIREVIPRFSFLLFAVLLVWNIVVIFRGAFSDDSITTVLGNRGTTLALLVPFSVVFGVNYLNIRRINRILIGLILGVIPSYCLFIFTTGFSNDILANRIFIVLLYNSVFLITIIPFQKAVVKFVIILGVLLLFYLSIKLGSRTMVFRILLLLIFLIGIVLYQKLNIRVVMPIAFITLLVPFVLIQRSISSGQSMLSTYLSEFTSIDLNDDTRTFIYYEVVNDLKQNNKVLIGKGSTGRYYSPYFRRAQGDSWNRLDIEVGILGLLVKGGLISVIINLLLLFIAIFLALFKTNNTFVSGIGFMLLVHTVLLFIENFVIYSSYNLLIWFFVGICLSKEIRELDNIDIKRILLNDPEYA